MRGFAQSDAGTAGSVRRPGRAPRRSFVLHPGDAWLQRRQRRQSEPQGGEVRNLHGRRGDLAALPRPLQPHRRLFQHQGGRRHRQHQRQPDAGRLLHHARHQFGHLPGHPPPAEWAGRFHLDPAPEYRLAEGGRRRRPGRLSLRPAESVRAGRRHGLAVAPGGGQLAVRAFDPGARRTGAARLRRADRRRLHRHGRVRDARLQAEPVGHLRQRSGELPAAGPHDRRSHALSGRRGGGRWRARRMVCRRFHRLPPP